MFDQAEALSHGDNVGSRIETFGFLAQLLRYSRETARAEAGQNAPQTVEDSVENATVEETVHVGNLDDSEEIPTTLSRSSSELQIDLD